MELNEYNFEELNIPNIQEKEETKYSELDYKKMLDETKLELEKYKLSSIEKDRQINKMKSQFSKILKDI